MSFGIFHTKILFKSNITCIQKKISFPNVMKCNVVGNGTMVGIHDGQSCGGGSIVPGKAHIGLTTNVVSDSCAV